jgi:hypothetical protein
MISDQTLSKIDKIHSLVSSDVNDRGMKHLVVEGDFLEAAKLFARTATASQGDTKPTLVILSGFPCLVQRNPPTETDGPNGAFALALCGVALGYKVIIATDDCNKAVFERGLDALFHSCRDILNGNDGYIELKAFPEESKMTSDQETELNELGKADLIIACERAGPSSDGKCYTMRGIDMNAHGLIAPLHRVVELARSHDGAKFIGIGDGGNELGMGKVIEAVHEHIPLGEKIGCVVEADYLVAASVSNWGAYALAGAAAVVRASDTDIQASELRDWISKCLVSEEADLHILKECMNAGCRDGIKQEMEEPYVDGMPAERSLECLRGIWHAAQN